MASENRSSGMWVGLTAIAALVFAFLPRPGGSPEPGKPDKPAKPAPIEALAPDDAAGEGPLAPIRSFLGPSGVPPRQGAAAPGWRAEQRYTVGVTAERALQIALEKRRSDSEARFYEWPDCCALADCRLRFLVATVPDPIDSGFAFMFDQMLEALQRALEQGHYVFDRAWLPWQRSAADKAPDPRLRERHPGMVLFRAVNMPDPKKRDLLAVLLVGETATGGIHKEAFFNAVRLVRDCPAVVKAPDDPVLLRVIGPHFSGSAFSLRIALEKAHTALRAHAPAAPDPLIKVVCGSATGFSHKEFVQPEWAGPDPATTKAFQATILPDRVLLQWLRKYLGNPANPAQATPARAVVLLHEANTGFGQNFVSDLKNRLKAPKGPPDFFLVPYPLHISQLRSAYTREQLARLESQGLPRGGRDLPFPSEEGDKEAGRHEAIGAQAPLLTAAINDLVLDNVVTTIVQKRGKYVCLVSTDPQDKIFLARRIRDRNPDVQIATVGSSLLFTHEEYNSALRGMAVASTYPLYPAVQGWSEQDTDKPVQTRVLFADESLEGSYNAALVQLADGHREPKLTEHLLDYGWEGKCPNDGTTLPPIWITVVGSNGQMIPVTHIPPHEYTNREHLGDDQDAFNFVFARPKHQRDGKDDAPRANPFGRLSAPSLSFLLFLILGGVNGYYFAQAWRYMRKSPWDATIEGVCCRYKQRVDFAVVCLAQVLLYGEIAVWGQTPVWAGPRLSLAYVGSVCLAGSSAIMMVMAWIVLLLAYRIEPFPSGGKRWTRFLQIATAPDRWLLGTPPGPPAAGAARPTPIPAAWAYLQAGRWARAGLWLGAADGAAFVVVSLALVVELGRMVWVMGAPGAEDVIHFDRLGQLSNGVSRLLPHLLLCTALFGWGFCLVKKLYLASHHAVQAPFPGAPAMFANLRKLDDALRAELVPPSTLRVHFGACVGLLVFAGIVFLSLWEMSVPPLDGKGFGLAALIAFSVGAFLLLFTLLQFYSAWHAMRKMLRFLALLPMEGAFGRLNEKVVGLFGHYLFAQRPRHSHLKISVQQVDVLRQLFPAFHDTVQKSASLPAQPYPPLDAAAVAALWVVVQAEAGTLACRPGAADDFAREVDAPGEIDYEPPPAVANEKEWGAKTGEDCRQIAESCLRVLDKLWPAQSLGGAFGGPPAGADHPPPAPAFLGLPESDPIRQWAMAAEDFVASEILRYLSQFTAQLRTLLMSLTIGSLLLVLAATVYPFFPQRQLLVGLTVLVGLVAAGIGAFLIQLNRDELISRVTRSTPNRFTPDFTFFQGAATYLLPILAAVMFQFPIVTSTLRSLLDPLFHIVQ